MEHEICLGQAVRKETSDSLPFFSLVHSIAEFDLAIELPQDHSRHTDQQIQRTEYAGQTAYHTDNYHSDIHEMLPLFLMFYSHAIIRTVGQAWNRKQGFLAQAEQDRNAVLTRIQHNFNDRVFFVRLCDADQENEAALPEDRGYAACMNCWKKAEVNNRKFYTILKF